MRVATTRSRAQVPFPGTTEKDEKEPIRADYDVLVVEDDLVIREQLADLFTDEGLRATTARDGREALDILEESGARVVVSDLMMPGMNGADLVRILRSTPGLSDVPVLFVTAVANAHRVPDGPVFLKPLDVDSLLRAVKIHAGRRAD